MGNRGYKVNHKRIQRIMKKLGLKGKKVLEKNTQV
ncbi:IS3 family transposase [Heyndrickxia sporothermodurans]